jgi:hypothetical protein
LVLDIRTHVRYGDRTSIELAPLPPSVTLRRRPRVVHDAVTVPKI